MPRAFLGVLLQKQNSMSADLNVCVYLVRMCVHAHTCHGSHVEVRTPEGVGARSPPMLFPGLNSGHQARWQSPLPDEPSHRLKCKF